MARRQVPALGGRPTCRDARQPRHQPRSVLLNSKRVPAPEPRTTGSQGHQAHWQSEMKNHRMEELRAPTAQTEHRLSRHPGFSCAAGPTVPGYCWSVYSWREPAADGRPQPGGQRDRRWKSSNIGARERVSGDSVDVMGDEKKYLLNDGGRSINVFLELTCECRSSATNA